MFYLYRVDRTERHRTGRSMAIGIQCDRSRHCSGVPVGELVRLAYAIVGATVQESHA